MDLFTAVNDPVAADLKTKIHDLDLNQVTPIDALNLLHKYKKIIEES